jgi:hypothetical protein
MIVLKILVISSQSNALFHVIAVNNSCFFRRKHAGVLEGRAGFIKR